MSGPRGASRSASGRSARAGTSGRTALFLYVLLVVLPAACFGLLLWRQLAAYQTRLLAELPVECRDAADRLAEAVAEQVEALLEDEMARPFEEYSRHYYRDDGGQIERVRSVLDNGPLRRGIHGYFSFRTSDYEPIGTRFDRPGNGTEQLQVFRGLEATAQDPLEARVRGVALEVTQLPIEDDNVADVERDVVQVELNDAVLEGYGEIRKRLTRTIVLNLAKGDEQECRDALQRSERLFDDHHEVYVQYFNLARVDLPGTERPYWALVAVRAVTMYGLQVPRLPQCIDSVTRPVMLQQGFVLDNSWLIGKLPQDAAKRVLGPSLRLVGPDETIPGSDDVTIARVDILDKLGLAPAGARETARAATGLRVVTDAGQLRREFRVQNAWFGGMAGLLTISMSIGIRLLLASIRKSRAEAERTRNFVASVTHELRTPIAAVKLYSEMLRDDWVEDAERRREYLGRIVSESDRLDGLVDRVLLRRRLYDGSVDAVEGGDLSAAVEAQRGDLELLAGRRTDDLEFDLAPDLPPVLLTTEGIHVIVQNLVENARKYAPVPRDEGGRPLERIVVRTRLDGKRRVVLEVLDRGPGIAEKDRGRVFEAFLRLGDERTRRTKGTGLGLHLVALQARALGGRVQVLPRAGGGSRFQVTFRRARGLG